MSSLPGPRSRVTAQGRAGLAWRFACLVCSSTLAGCAGTYATKDGPPPRDFSVAGAVPDMASGVGGNGGSGGSGDLAMPAPSSGGDLAAPAQGSGPDMTPTGPPDLMPACLASLGHDGGVAPRPHPAAPGPSHTPSARRFDR